MLASSSALQIFLWVTAVQSQGEEASGDTNQEDMLAMLNKQWKIASDITNDKEWAADFADQYEPFKVILFIFVYLDIS